ncbi:hypothetical protein QVN91_03420 [Bacteroides caecigallinarum]|nr:hypothetical protein [Bacteroides caecigallinarum]
MNTQKVVYYKDKTEILRERIFSIYPEKDLSIIDVTDYDDDKDFVILTIQYSSPDMLIRLGEEIQYVRTYYQHL